MIEGQEISTTINIINEDTQDIPINIAKNNYLVDELFEKLQNQFNDSQLILKTLQNNLKILHKEVLKERKDLNKQILKSKKNKKKRNTLSGFAIPSQISKELSEFLELENENVKISRTDVTSRIIKYIKDNHNPLPSIKSVRRDNFFINVASENKHLVKILKKLDMSEIQRSYLF